jgi:hypothetical protein
MTFVVLVPVCVMRQAENLNKFSSSSVMSAFKQPNVISVASSGSELRSTTKSALSQPRREHFPFTLADLLIPIWEDCADGPIRRTRLRNIAIQPFVIPMSSVTANLGLCRAESIKANYHLYRVMSIEASPPIAAAPCLSPAQEVVRTRLTIEEKKRITNEEYDRFFVLSLSTELLQSASSAGSRSQ